MRGTRDKVAVIVSLVLVGNVATAVTDMTVFGLTIGEPARLPECLPFSPALKIPGMYSPVQPVTCKKSINLLPEMRFHEIVIGTSMAPTWVRRSTLQILESEGNVIGVSFFTNGFAEQDVVLRKLTEKYGTPTALDTLPKQIGIGTKFESLDATWKFEGLTVHFTGVVNRADQGFVSINTPESSKMIDEIMNDSGDGRQSL
jgi:hypothetical protein